MPRDSSRFQFKHGDHTCVFYHSEDALMEVLTPYIAEGLNRGERCFCVQKPRVRKRLLSDLRALGFPTDDLLERGILEIQSAKKVYFKKGRFDPHAMMDMLMQSLNQALRSGFTAFRTAGDLTWVLEDHDEFDRLIAYEGLVNAYYPTRRAIGLCQYDANAFTSRMLESVVKTHDHNVWDTIPSNRNYSGMSVRSGNYLTEIVTDRRAHPTEYHYVVQRRRPTGVVGWGVVPTFKRARAEAERIIRNADKS